MCFSRSPAPGGGAAGARGPTRAGGREEAGGPGEPGGPEAAGGRFSGRPRLRAGGGGGHQVGVEAEALLTDPDDVGTLQDALPLHALIVDERPVGARVHQQVALSGLDDFRVTARDVLPGSDDVAPRLAPEHHRRARDHILPAVGKAHHPAARVGGGARLAGGPNRRHRLRHLHLLDELRAAGAALVHERELVAPDFHLIAVEQRGRLGTQPHAIDEHFGCRCGLADDHLPVRLPLEHGVARQHACPGQRDRAGRVAAQRHLADREAELPVTEF
ncbi:MAG: hypothetical protein AUH78_17005 [Gemmatimonadetes bacterium 13_1_40CM_4_69_8]|nr:MAG: hypothetical protein AUH78_17005 [Gemmatimonadetes bacterium 13_1_40CM_4_69_8]